MDDKDRAMESDINLKIHSKLNQDCRVLIEDVNSPLLRIKQPPMMARITQRRQSLRIMGQTLSSMKECLVKPTKKKVKSNDFKESRVLVDKIKSVDPVNNLQTNSNDFTDLPDNVIFDLIADVTGYIENGTWSNSTSDSGELSSIISTTTDTSAQSSDFLSNSTKVGVSQSSISTQTCFDEPSSISKQKLSDQRSAYTQTTIEDWDTLAYLKTPKSKNHQMNFVPYQPTSNFDWMMETVSTLLVRPCRKFLNREQCGPFCEYNHLLPSAHLVAATIRDWPNEMINFFYTTHVQHYYICYTTYFEVICNIYAERRLLEEILATVKDCEVFGIYNNLNVIWHGLNRCGYSKDEALFVVYTRINGSPRMFTEIIKIILKWNVTNFKQTIGFLSNQKHNYILDHFIGNDVLKQACEAKSLDVNLIEFCSFIISQFVSNNTANLLNEQYMAQLLQRINSRGSH